MLYFSSLKIHASLKIEEPVISVEVARALNPRAQSLKPPPPT